ncbi:MAG TPA: 4-hydroxyphenylpyruvate dioxygenase [Micromonosporaceae bacterium]|nr:4-hydroxyphenylpyruvate dioxygenase [Micromonosporaceae bacterium]
MPVSTRSLRDLHVEYVEFYVNDAAATATDLARRYGLEVAGARGDRGGASDHYSMTLRRGEVGLVVTEPTDEQHPAALFVQRHGAGVANIAMRTPDARDAFAAAVARGARPVTEPVAGPDGSVSATIAGFGDVTHTFVERPRDNADRGVVLPGATPVPPGPGQPGLAGLPAPDLRTVDHFAVCLEAGTLDPTVEFYESALDFSVIFQERIVVGAQAMLSKVVQSASQQVTFTLIEPDPSAEAGQIDEFLKNHAGPGVQHVAFSTGSIVAAVSAAQARGVEFLTTPAAYYRLLAQRMELVRYGTDDLRALNILVDEDHDGQLFQIFARSAHPRRTFFFELIERLGARTFGSGNIKALYEAVEAERIKPQDVL